MAPLYQFHSNYAEIIYRFFRISGRKMFVKGSTIIDSLNTIGNYM
jgi:hypothetical protein